MAIRNLEKIFRPHRVAIVGASDQPGKVGFTLLRNMITAGFAGVVYPVNAKRDSVQGIQAYASVADLPHPVDLAVICTPAATVPQVIRQCGEAGTRGAIVISAGFREVGEAGRALERQVREEAARFDGFRIIGPNCLGVIVPGTGLNASFAAATPKPGHVAFLSQSGALCTSVLDWALEEEIGFSHFVSIGNMLDVGVGDLIDYFGADPSTESIVLYVESITEARQFMSAARAFARRKPIVVYKAGRFAQSAKAAASHTGAMAGVDAVYDAAFQRAGAVRVTEVDDLFDCAELLGRKRIPKGPRLAIVTNAGGPGVMATDALLDRHGMLAALPDALIAKLDSVLPAYWSHGNPVDILGDAPPERFGQALACLLAEPTIDAVMTILTPQAMTDPSAAAKAVAEAATRSQKPVLAVWMGGKMVHEGVQILNRFGVPTYQTPEHAVRSFMYLVTYARNLETLYETPRDVPLTFKVDRSALRSRFEKLAAKEQPILSEEDSKDLLEAYGIPVTRRVPAATPAEAVAAGGEIGYPVVLKIASPAYHAQDRRRRSDAEPGRRRRGGSGLQPDARVVPRRSVPRREIEGVTVQPMVVAADGVRADRRRQARPGVRRRDHGRHGRRGGRSVPGPGLGPAAAQRAPGSAACSNRCVPGRCCRAIAAGRRCNIDRLIEILMRFSYLVGRLSGDQGVRHQPAAGHA